ncbi:MAG: hypothetical protein ACYTGC_18140, partial [Planctomycetota bacterium]
GGDRSGEVARIIDYARSYRSEVESTLGSDARYFASLLPAYQRQPEMVVRRLWLETYGRVLEYDDAEIIYAPRDLASLQLRVSGLESVANVRRDRAMQRREAQANQSILQELGLRGRTRRAQDMQMGGPGRQLDVSGGAVRSKGGN